MRWINKEIKPKSFDFIKNRKYNKHLSDDIIKYICGRTFKIIDVRDIYDVENLICPNEVKDQLHEDEIPMVFIAVELNSDGEIINDKKWVFFQNEFVIRSDIKIDEGLFKL